MVGDAEGVSEIRRVGAALVVGFEEVLGAPVGAVELVGAIVSVGAIESVGLALGFCVSVGVIVGLFVGVSSGKHVYFVSTGVSAQHCPMAHFSMLSWKV